VRDLYGKGHKVNSGVTAMCVCVCVMDARHWSCLTLCALPVQCDHQQQQQLQQQQ